MTTVCAWKDPESGSIWLGSDQQLSCGDLIERTDFVKWNRLGSDCWLGISGDPALADLADELLRRGPGIGGDAAQNFAAALGAKLRDLGWNLSSREIGESPYLQSCMLCAWRGDLYELFPEQPWAMHIPAGRFAAIGSGLRFAYGAWEALEGLSLPPRQAMAIAVQAAISRDVHSGGQPWVLEWKP